MEEEKDERREEYYRESDRKKCKRAERKDGGVMEEGGGRWGEDDGGKTEGAWTTNILINFFSIIFLPQLQKKNCRVTLSGGQWLSLPSLPPSLFPPL